jgi:hypothetical protein
MDDVEKVLVFTDKLMMENMLHKAGKCKEIQSPYHEANCDARLGCPDISSKAKINRYKEALKIYDEPTCPLSNATFNEIFRNTNRFLNDKERKQLYKKMKEEKIGDYGRNN